MTEQRQRETNKNREGGGEGKGREGKGSEKETRGSRVGAKVRKCNGTRVEER